MKGRLKDLYHQRVTLVAESRKILDAAETEKRKLTAEETQQWDKMAEEIDALGAEIGRRERQAEVDRLLETPGDRLVPPNADPHRSAGGQDGQPIALTWGSRQIALKPGSREHACATDAYRRQFDDYLRSGQIGAVLQAGDNSQGGYFTSTQMSANIVKFLDNMVFMRQLADVQPPLQRAVSLGVVSWDTDPADADWTVEIPASDLTADTTARIGKRELVPQLLTKFVQISLKLLRAGVIDVESYVVSRLGYVFSITEEQAFMTGSGASQPLGIFTASADGISTSRDVTAYAVDDFEADDLINMKYNVKSGYMQRGSWIMHRDSVKVARKLKDGNGQYLWRPGLATDLPDTLLDRPVYMSEYAPNTFTTGLYLAVFGDFRTGYWIVDAMGLEVQRLVEQGALQNKLGLVARKETDGMPVLEEAFSRLILA